MAFAIFSNNCSSLEEVVKVEGGGEQEDSSESQKSVNEEVFSIDSSILLSSTFKKSALDLIVEGISIVLLVLNFEIVEM